MFKVYVYVPSALTVILPYVPDTEVPTFEVSPSTLTMACVSVLSASVTWSAMMSPEAVSVVSSVAVPVIAVTTGTSFVPVMVTVTVALSRFPAAVWTV